MARAKGEGSWDEHIVGGHKYHRLRVTIDGKKKPFYGKTKTEAMQKYREYIANYTPGIKKTALTVCDVAREAVESRKGQLKETTYNYYQRAIKALGKSKLGVYQIHSVDFSDVQEYINSLADEYTMATIKRQRVTLSITFSYAEDRGWIEKNPMHKVKLPNQANIVKETKDHVFLTTDERKALEKESELLNDKQIHNGKIGTPLYGITAKAVVFILHTGLRMGELRALYWEDVDMDKRFIHIRKNAPTSGEKMTTPKRKSSIRSVPLDSVAFGIIEELSADKCGKLVFHTKSGGMISRNDTDRTLKTMIKRSGITQNPTIHDLRHTYASELIRKGVDMKTVQVVLGHSDISTTMNIYVHKSDDDLDILKSILD